MKKAAIIEIDFRVYYPKPYSLFQYLECVHYGEKETTTPTQEFDIVMDPNENLFAFTLKSAQDWQILYS